MSQVMFFESALPESDVKRLANCQSIGRPFMPDWTFESGFKLFNIRSTRADHSSLCMSDPWREQIFFNEGLDYDGTKKNCRNLGGSLTTLTSQSDVRHFFQEKSKAMELLGNQVSACSTRTGSRTDMLSLYY